MTYANGTLTLFGAGHSTVATLTFNGNYSTGDFTLEEQHGTAEVLYSSSPALNLQDFLPPGLVPNAQTVQIQRFEAAPCGIWNANSNIADWHYWPSLHV